MEGLTRPVLESPVVLSGRAELGRVKVKVLVLAGRGRERYCRDVLALEDRKPLWSLLDTSRLILRPPALLLTGLTGMADVLGFFPTVAGLFVVVLAVGMLLLPVLFAVVVGGFLKPKFPPVDGRTRPEGGLRGSAATEAFFSLPASDDDRCRPEDFTARRDFSMGFPSGFTTPGTLSPL